MTEPTLTELREMARRTVTRRHHESEEGMLANAFLALTGTEPLTAEHCRAAETGSSIDGTYFVMDNGVIASGGGGEPFGIDIPFATVGQLRLAMMQENRDEE